MHREDQTCLVMRGLRRREESKKESFLVLGCLAQTPIDPLGRLWLFEEKR